MLALINVTKSFGERTVLDGLHLDVKTGESVALVGANGSGKTTTLRCTVGLAHPDSGRILIDGIDTRRGRLAAMARVSYLPQRSVFPLTLTVRETLAVVARLRRLPPRDVDRELEACDLEALAARPVSVLSGGERQRLAMAVAFLPRVPLYLFDEPSANLDLAAARILFSRARELKEEGRTLLFTTHVPADIRHLASRVVLLKNGRIESDVTGEFDVRRAERRLEFELFGGDDAQTAGHGRARDWNLAGDRMRDAGAGAAARAGGSR